MSFPSATTERWQRRPIRGQLAMLAGQSISMGRQTAHKFPELPGRCRRNAESLITRARHMKNEARDAEFVAPVNTARLVLSLEAGN